MHDMAIFLGGIFSNENITRKLIDEKMLIDTLPKLYLQKSFKNSTKICYFHRIKANQ